MDKASIEIKEKVEVIERGHLLSSFVQLAKLRVTFFVALSSFFGYIFFDGFSHQALLVASGVFLTAVASSAINQYQERKYDKLMTRTRQRPLPSNKLRKEEALIFIIFSGLLGIFLLGLTFNFTAVGLAVFSIIWYNLVYTPLKRKTAFAVLPGALLGAIPPVIGWTVAGGDVFSPKILFIAILFFLFQIPHFWFLFLIYNDDYKQAGYPTLKDTLTISQIGRISFVWIVCLAIVAVAEPFFFVNNPLFLAVIFGMSVILIWKNKFLLNLEEANETNSYRIAFRTLNVYVLMVVVLLTIEKIISN
ncbi:MAG TPA: protoheme IX farnesyltransferase [Candidatus Kapabacteria bacterium]|nr:protoheme IX farnesyltransferase [Candidatus Kapabacteria bacterium]HPU24433.1 protoheme IX farnesyltransferase [Candidatus Kapabacteria bacterium]